MSSDKHPPEAAAQDDSAKFPKPQTHRSNELSRAETRYRSIFHHSGSPSIIVEADFTISMANPKFEELTGYRRDEIEGRMKWIDFIATEDRNRVRRYHAARREKEGAAPPEYETRIADRQGNDRHVFIKVGMLPEPGSTIASLIDITSLKQTELDLRNRKALYSAILTGYEGVVYFIGQDYRIRFMNENLIAQVGRDATGERCYQAIHNRRTKCLWCVSDQVFQGQTVRFEMKNPNDGKWYRSVNVPVRLSDANYCQAMVTDIDEQKRMEEALRDSDAHLREENLRLRSTIEDRHQFGDIVGRSGAMQEVYELTLMAAASDTNIIIYGESGTGKELVANAVHNMSLRRNGRFVPINCGAIPENLLESEFFGHKRGAFTGADADKTGYLDQADGGSLFLDEIGEIKPDLQVKLLRAIEGGGYTPVGSNEVRKPDFRIIAATSRNLAEMVQQGMMRSDFFYRVHVIPIHLPPLRNRKEDIPLLVEHFMKAYDRKIRPKVTDRVIDTLMNYNWPGNVRELQNVLYRFVTLQRLDLVGDTLSIASVAAEPENVAPNAPLAKAVAVYETRRIAAALAQNRWNRTRTARYLGIGLRTLQRKMKDYDIQ
ncbi:MAG: sigma 54-interacting transcriptional regulator [Desulfobacterales bacterium]|nr:sigma 54-interacting transcriptional regulator [Desulfobacterales bacterium]